jgi:hypothetical protein
MRYATIGIIVAGALMTVSATTASAQTVRACINVTNGKFRLMEITGCSSREQQVEWNIQGLIGLTGPMGPAGPQGPAGAQGALGLSGPKGDSGTNGAPGAQGPQGLAGAKGEAGTNGAPGQLGPQGPAGAQGAQGPQGLAGAKGDAGTNGAPGQLGPQGPAGAQGAQGPQGPAGAQGAQGPQGLTGAAGRNGLPGAQGATGAQGPQGPAGADGRTFVQGGLLVVDAAGQDVGYAIDVYNSYVARKAGNETVWLVAPTDGLPRDVMYFFHTEPSCGGERYVQTMAVRGFAYFAQVHDGVMTFTKTIDPYGANALPVLSYELIGATEDAMLPGRCLPMDGRLISLGVATTVFDPALATLIPPFRIK